MRTESGGWNALYMNDIGRRKRMKWFVWAGAALAVLGLITVFLKNQNDDLQTTSILVDIGLPTPICIVHLSDLHGKLFARAMGCY